MSDIIEHKPLEPQPWSKLKILRWKSGGVFVVVIVAIIILVSLFGTIIDNLYPREPMVLGATFSSTYAQSLGLDWRNAYTASLDDLGVRLFRIPAYWNQIEPKSHVFDFSDLDWMLDEAVKRDAKVILATGMRLPRWPECHIPDWAKNLKEDEFRSEILIMLRTVVQRYGSHPAVIAWQVENEPLLESFGECPEPNIDFLKEEVNFVRNQDNHPIIVTESGEFSSWLGTAGISDVVGISMYRVAWNNILGQIFYPIGPSFYRNKAKAVRLVSNKIIVSELQAEPWASEGILNMPLEDQFKSMNSSHLKENIRFASRAGFDETLLWGIEWWYWLKEKQNEDSVWNTGKSLFEKSPLPSDLR